MGIRLLKSAIFLTAGVGLLHDVLAATSCSTSTSAAVIISAAETSTCTLYGPSLDVQSGGSISTSGFNVGIAVPADPTNPNQSNISVEGSGVVTSPSYIGFRNSSSQFNNLSVTSGGSLDGGTYGGIWNDANINQISVTSGGSIRAHTGGGYGGVYNNSGASINQISVIGVGSSITNDSYAINNVGSIGAISLQDSGAVHNTAIGSEGAIQNDGLINTIGIDQSSSIQAAWGVGISNRYGTLGTLSNSGSILSTNAYGEAIYNGNLITSITNTATGHITAGEVPGISTVGGYGINNRSRIDSITNSGAITAYATRDVSGSINPADQYGMAILNSVSSASIGTITNNTGGTISGDYVGITNILGATIDQITNQSGGTISSSYFAIGNDGVTGRIENAGNIVGLQDGISNTGTITNIVNSGTISGSSEAGVLNFGPGPGVAATISTITNTGSITSSSGFGIWNDTDGVIGVLNNAQGAGNALTYKGTLPTNYNIIITSASNYGKLVVTSGTGPTTFGIYTGSKLTKGTYASALSGVSRSNLNNLSGNYSGFTWALNNSSGSIWDLVVIGASTADTQQSLVNTANALQPIYTLQNSVLANSFTYDCSVFGANGVCVSAGGRNTSVQGANGLNNTSALLIASYRLDKNNSRIGAYADQNLSMNNSGSAVTLGNNTPLIGVFGVWSQRPDGIGAEVKVSAAYGQKDTTITRQVVGDSEAGSGSSTLNSQGAQVIAKYGFGLADSIVVSPYVGVRYTQNNMGGYTEATSTSVTAPLTYSALNTNATTALAGVGASYTFIPQAMLFASAGVETDTNTANGTYSATGVTGLTPINFNANPVKTRPTATVGAYYDLVKNQRLGVTGIYRQEPYQAVSTTTVMATYTIGL